MKLVLFCLMSIQIFAICPACLKRRAEMMAKRPSLETALLNFAAKIAKMERVKEDFNQNFYQDFFKKLHADVAKTQGKLKPTARFYFGKSMIEHFASYPKLLNDIRTARSENIRQLALIAPSYFDSSFSFLSKNPLTDRIIQALDVLKTAPAYQPIHEKFHLYTHLLNKQTMRSAKPNLNLLAYRCLALDYERLRCLEKTQYLPEIEVAREALTDLAKLHLIEEFLRNVAADCFKLPNETDTKLAQIQKDYMHQRSECIRKNRELQAYR